MDGVKKEIFTNKDGFIVFYLDQGEYELELKWEETDLRKFADFISIFGIILLVYFYFKK